MTVHVLEFGSHDPMQQAQIVAFASASASMAERCGLSPEMFLDSLLACVATWADVKGRDPIAKVQLLDAMHARARHHLINLMTAGATPQ